MATSGDLYLATSGYFPMATDRTRIELDNAIFEYLEIFHNRQRRHSAACALR